MYCSTVDLRFFDNKRANKRRLSPALFTCGLDLAFPMGSSTCCFDIGEEAEGQKFSEKMVLSRKVSKSAGDICASSTAFQDHQDQFKSVTFERLYSYLQNYYQKGKLK
jgi:hypothetical protein